MSLRSLAPRKLSLLLALAAAAWGPHAAAQDYFAGKALELLVGSDPAGGYDTYGRTLARHMPKYIPGSPVIAVKNLPGAGSALV